MQRWTKAVSIPSFFFFTRSCGSNTDLGFSSVIFSYVLNGAAYGTQILSHMKALRNTYFPWKQLTASGSFGSRLQVHTRIEL